MKLGSYAKGGGSPGGSQGPLPGRPPARSSAPARRPSHPAARTRWSPVGGPQGRPARLGKLNSLANPESGLAPMANPRKSLDCPVSAGTTITVFITQLVPSAHVAPSAP